MILIPNSLLYLFLSYVTFLSFIKISFTNNIDEIFAKQKILQKILDHFQLEKPLIVDASSKVIKKYENHIDKSYETDESKKAISFVDIPSYQILFPIIFFKIPKILNSNVIKEAFIKLDYYSKISRDKNKIFYGDIYVMSSNDKLLECIGNVTFGETSSLNNVINVPLDVNLLSKAINATNGNINLFIKIHNEESYFPYSLNFASLNLHSLEKKRRKKRNAENICQSKSSENSCCLRSLKINFDEIGWNFIISPKEINTNYCYGKCYSYKSDSLVGDAIYRLHSISKKEHRSCCYPTQFRELNITIFKEGSFIETKIINDILIKKCSCY
uniref:TGFbeta ligand n=1 Tax=Strongyloides stercoralis TaxID=6248 RepID=A0A0K0DZA8_STRER|nr:TGFbeta ligand [Strongyloides stercoralis]